jgi:DNA invertase Pin-like site-specific DNA recombinase
MAEIEKLVQSVKRSRAEFESQLDELEVAKEEYHEGIRRLYESGASLRWIADELGLSHQRVHQIVAGTQDDKR